MVTDSNSSSAGHHNSKTDMKMSRIMANRSMTSSTMLIIFLWSSGIVVSQGLPTTEPTATELLFTGLFTEVTDTDTEGYEEETTTLPIDDDTVAMTTIDAITTSSPDEPEKGIWKFVKVKFTLPNKTETDIGRPLRQEIKDGINPILQEKIDKDYNISDIAFSSGSLVAEVQLDFYLRITREERREVIKVFYEVVERNHTLGTLRVEKLYVWNPQGEYYRIEDACSITICPEKMRCSPQGNECTSKCAGNENYCHHDHGECEEVPQRSTFIICKCEEGFTGAQCDRRIGHDEREADLYVGIIAASAIAGIIVLAIILATCINLFNKRRIRTGRSEELFGIENVVALELVDEKLHFDGTATQTDESFLLARSHKDGVAPKAGHAHKIMQTNDSFLLAKAQLLRAHGSATRYRGAGSPVGVVSGNTRRLSDRPVGSKVSDADATPSTSTSGANGVARKPSTKKDRAPDPPQQNSASTSQDQEATPSTSKGEFSSQEIAPKPTDSPIENDEGNIEVPPPEKPISADGSDGMSDAYAGRKILKV